MKTWKKNAIFFLVSVVAVLFTSVEGFAAYKTTIEGSSSVKVAAVASSIVVTPIADTTTVVLNSSGKTPLGVITVSNSENGKVSEVSLKYAISLLSDVAVPDCVTMELYALSTDAEKTAFVNDGTIPASAAKIAPTSISSDRKTFEFSQPEFTLCTTTLQEKTYAWVLSWPGTSNIAETALSFSVKLDETQVD